MLDSLVVENLGVISYAELELERGLVVITGETGAGKTLLTTALGLLLGARGSPELIGPNGDVTRVAAQLTDGDRELLLRRDISATGRSRVRIDREVVTLAELGEATAHEVEIFGQHLAATLTQPAAQLRILDRYGACDDNELRTLRSRAAQLTAQLTELRARGSERLRRIEFIDFELELLEDAKLVDADEDHRVEDEIARLASTRDRQALLTSLHDVLVGETGLLDEIARLSAEARVLMPEFAPRLDNLVEEIEDLAHESRDLLEAEVEDPAALAQLEERLGVLVSLKRRFGGTLAHVLDTKDALAQERSQLEGSAQSESAIVAELAALEPKIQAALEELRAARHRAAIKLTTAVRSLLVEVALVNATFDIKFEDVDAILPTFYFSANPGISPMPLGRVASGGELSRVMLAIARVAGASTPTLIFDEIDAGIGGATGLRVAEVLKAMAGEHQVLVVTHLAQIAAAANQHIVVTKSATSNTVATRLEVVDGAARVQEIARMLSGHPESPQAQDHARDLIARFLHD